MSHQTVTDKLPTKEGVYIAAIGKRGEKPRSERIAIDRHKREAGIIPIYPKQWNEARLEANRLSRTPRVPATSKKSPGSRHATGAGMLSSRKLNSEHIQRADSGPQAAA